MINKVCNYIVNIFTLDFKKIFVNGKNKKRFQHFGGYLFKKEHLSAGEDDVMDKTNNSKTAECRRYNDSVLRKNVSSY